ncbi:MAG: VanZ family protein [Polaribacter sp.]
MYKIIYVQKVFKILGILFFVFIIWIIYLANTGKNSLFFDFTKSFPYSDKLGHFLLFGCLTLLGIIALNFRGFKIGKKSIYYSTAFVFTFVVLEECSQYFIASRTFDLVDLSADILGIIVASCIANFIKKASKKTT